MVNRFNSKFLKQIAIKMTAHIGKWLVKPSDKITEPGSYRNARLLSVFVLSLFLLFLLVNLSYAFTIPGYTVPPADLLGYGFLLTIYLISRTRLTRLAVIMLLFMFPLNVFMNVLSGTTQNITATLLFLIPSYVIASIFLRAIGVAIYGLSVSAMIGLLPLIASQFDHSFSSILGPLAVSIIVVVLLAIAVEHRNHIEQDRQVELREAYDHALESWARALEIRDKDTEGHSRRVAEMTVELATACGIHKKLVENIYRGALLHDIGKMAIPDSILHKPAALSAEEWVLMHQHPLTALSLLEDIPYLASAMDIPFCHHEWWNGEGYPNHLKGESIPLSARVFAVVDTWDALTSDRPYRPAWKREDALQYIQEQSGTKFDPHITPKFIKLIHKHKLV